MDGPPPSCRNRAHGHRSCADHALVERLLSKTNSFHFALGEATVMLEDVAFMYSLPIDGSLVAGRTFLGKLVAPVCEEVLGITPQKKINYVGITVKFKWLEDNFNAT